MRKIDHFMFGVKQLPPLAEAFALKAGLTAETGGKHRSFGTYNQLIGGGSSPYIELIAPDEQSDASSVLRSELEALNQPTLHRFIVRATLSDFDGLTAAYAAAGIEADVVALSRESQTGEMLHWHLLIPRPNALGVLAPYFIDWGDAQHPSERLADQFSLLACEAGHPKPDVVQQLWNALGVSIPVIYAEQPELKITIQSPQGAVQLP